MADSILDSAISANVLTTPGAFPFHAVLEISSEASSATQHHGQIEIFWATPTHYSLVIDSPEFHQRLIVDGDKVQETDEGDFYPGWLQDFVGAVLDPLAHAKDLRGHPNAYDDSPQFAYTCVKRDDRLNGVTNDLTFAQICFDKRRGRQLAYVLDFTHFLALDDFTPFHTKLIAHSYKVSTRDDTKLQGTLTTLEDWTPKESELAVTSPTPPSGRILTSVVSTETEESLLQSAPKDVHWPSVREGKLDGYVIVHAITDRTGKVREAAQYNSDDNLELAPFSRQIALQYKFKPLLVDGVPQQMEMPLVLHFKTAIDNPIPEVNDAWLRANAKHCKIPTEVSRPSAAGKQVEITLHILADGKLKGISGGDGAFAMYMFREFPSCMLPPVLQNGQASEYIAHLTVMAK
jgi:hypothetical protein